MLSVERERVNTVSQVDPYSHFSLVLVLLGRSCLGRHVSLRILVAMECVSLPRNRKQMPLHVWIWD